MNTVKIDCRRIAETYFDWVRTQIRRLPDPPCIATVLNRASADPGSLQYRKFIHKDAEKVGVRTLDVEEDSERGILGAVRRLNADPKVQGIVVLYPLGLERKDDEIMDLVSPEKDIEGLHSINLGYLIKFRRYLDEKKGVKCVVPATAKAVVKALQCYPQIQVAGSLVTIVNNSMRVGKPLGLMLENLGATVVKCYDRTRRSDLEDCVRRSDIVVSAVPDAAFQLDPSWIKKGAAVIDVSYQGNIDAQALDGCAALLSAPDNRIGRMTRAMMFVNLVYCAHSGGSEVSVILPETILKEGVRGA